MAACKTSNELHHNFPKLAEESGFHFNTHRQRNRIDWNKIRVIDVEHLVRDKKFIIIEQHVNDVLDCVLESEFDLRILDEGVVKIFRLAQLAVEYQQFCRHYLDRSVYVLREEITTLAQELDRTRKENRDKDEELRKLRKKTRRNVGSLPYGNDNIANMILKTLNNRGDFLNTASSSEVQHYNKCNYCNKVFLNQLYLKGHISRRHGNVTETPEKDIKIVEIVHEKSESNKLNDEVMQLKAKLNEMEAILCKPQENEQETKIAHFEKDKNDTVMQETKNDKVSNNIESLLIEKMEEWKKEEHEKHKNEISILQAQIAETADSFKRYEIQKSDQSEKSLLDNLNLTIKEQGIQIESLKKELLETKRNMDKEEPDKHERNRQEFEAQISFWVKRADEQAQQYDALLKNLNEVAREAHESHALAKAENERAEHLQSLLGEELNKRNNVAHQEEESLTKEKEVKSTIIKVPMKKIVKPNSTKADRTSLEELQMKAQELLDMQFTTSSESSSVDDLDTPLKNKEAKKRDLIAFNKKERNRGVFKKKNEEPQKPIEIKTDIENEVKIRNSTKKETLKRIKPKKEKSRSHSNLNLREKDCNGPIERIVPASPLKLVRAKLVEEVNNKLVAAGVDPLKRKIPFQVFQKQRGQLQQIQELKSKKNPSHLRVRHSILTYLDSTTPQSKQQDDIIEEYTSPNKLTKSFSFGSVISNVKSKAMSFVKANDFHKSKRKDEISEVAKKALSFLRTPPGSETSSPKKENTTMAADTKALKDTGSSVLNNKNTIKIKAKTKRKYLETDSDTDSLEIDNHQKPYKESSKSIKNLIQSPARRPSSANADYVSESRKYKSESITRAQSTNNFIEYEEPKRPVQVDNDENINNTKILLDSPIKKYVSEDNLLKSPKQTKGVLKNASSTSSLNKKKVLFDMDAIQMKSVSASPSQSITEKSDENDRYELGLVNLEDEEWDISSIDNEPLKNDTKIQVNSRTSPKIAELKHKIESQLSRRNETPPTALVGGFDMLKGHINKTSSTGGSNTSLGSSILDESEGAQIVEHKVFIKPKHVKEKDDSELDLSEFSIDGIIRNKDETHNDSF